MKTKTDTLVGSKITSLEGSKKYRSRERSLHGLGGGRGVSRFESLAV